jgi:hypothetical protein
VGTVETVIEVTGGATLIETETARVSDTRNVTQLRDMPLNSRAIWAQLSLVPNVLQASAGSTIRFSGSRTNQSHWSIDGTTMSDGVRDADRAAGQLRRVVRGGPHRRREQHGGIRHHRPGDDDLEGGTNTFHGSLFDYYSTPWFRARNPFAPARPTGISHCLEAARAVRSTSPSVYDGRNKSFFFFSFETFRGSQTTQTFNPTVPLQAWRSGDFSALTTPVLDPLTRQPFPGNRIPADRLNPTAAAMQRPLLPGSEFREATALQNQNYIGRISAFRPWTRTTGWSAATTGSRTGLRHGPVHAAGVRSDRLPECPAHDCAGLCDPSQPRRDGGLHQAPSLRR